MNPHPARAATAGRRDRRRAAHRAGARVAHATLEPADRGSRLRDAGRRSRAALRRNRRRLEGRHAGRRHANVGADVRRRHSRERRDVDTAARGCADGRSRARIAPRARPARAPSERVHARRGRWPRSTRYWSGSKFCRSRFDGDGFPPFALHLADNLGNAGYVVGGVDARLRVARSRAPALPLHARRRRNATTRSADIRRTIHGGR